MEPWELALRTVLLGLSLIMTIVAFQARRRSGRGRMTWVLLSFAAFTVLAAAALLGEMMDDPSWQLSNNLLLILLLIIAANYLALLRG